METAFDYKTLCALCGEILDTSASQCPMRNPVQTGGRISTGYSSVANNIVRLNELGALPLELPIPILNETSESLATTFSENHASRHVRCKAKFSFLKVERAEIAKGKHGHVDSAPHCTRNYKQLKVADSKCFICDIESDAKLISILTTRSRESLKYFPELG